MCVVVNGNSSRGGGTAEERQLLYNSQPQRENGTRERAQSNSEHALTFPPHRSYYCQCASNQFLILPRALLSLSLWRAEIIYTAAVAGGRGSDASFVPITRSKMRLPFKSARRSRGAAPINEFCTDDN